MRHHQLLKSQEVADGLGNLRCPQLHLDGNPCAISRMNDAVERQIAKMHELWNLLPEKPEWLTEEEVDCMEDLLVGLRDGRIDPENPFQQPEASDMEHDER